MGRTDYYGLPTLTKKGHVRVVVETPRGSAVKLRWDPELRVFEVARLLPLGMVYPRDWGFVPSTWAADGDPVDAMILLDVPTAPGVVVTCRPIGVIRVSQRDGQMKARIANDRLVAQPTDDERHRDARDLPKRMRRELERFFEAILFASGKRARIEGWERPNAAEELLRQAKRKYADHHKRRAG